MKVELPPSSAAFVEAQIRQGGFSTPEDVVVAALETLRADCAFGDFAPGELDRLLAEGEASEGSAGWFTGDEARRELALRLRQRGDAQS